MYSPKPKRKQLIERWIVYGLMTVSILVIVGALAFVTLGYQLDREQGKITQGGLLQFKSSPSGALVTVDGRPLDAFNMRTPSKTTSSSGEHSVKMSLAGYRDWQKTVQLRAGSVLWLNYARLIPEDTTPASVMQFPTLGGTLVSPDRKYIIVLEQPDKPALRLLNISGDKPVSKDIVLPAASLTPSADGKTNRFILDSWDAHSRYVLVQHFYTATDYEWILVDNENIEKTINITTLFDVQATKILLDSGNNSLFVQTGSEVRKINLSEETISRPLIHNVGEFAVNGNGRLLFTTNPDVSGVRQVGYYDVDAKKPRIIREIRDSAASVHVAAGVYYSQSYVTIAHGSTVEVMKLELPKSDSTAKITPTQIASFTLHAPVLYLDTKTSGRFVVAQTATEYTVYDLELEKLTTTPIVGARAEAPGEMKWIDGYMPWSDRDGVLRLYEFDGGNQAALFPVAPGYSVTLSQNEKYLYTFTRAADGSYALSRLQMAK